MLIDIEISVSDDKPFFVGTKFQPRQLVEGIGQNVFALKGPEPLNKRPDSDRAPFLNIQDQPSRDGRGKGLIIIVF